MHRFEIKYRSRQSHQAPPGQHVAYVTRAINPAHPLEAHIGYVERSNEQAGRSEDLVMTETKNLPTWAHNNVQQFWAACEQWERGDARLAITWELTMPRSLTVEQSLALTQGFLTAQFGEHHCYTVGMHNTVASDGGRNLHAHVVWSERPTDQGIIDPQRFFSRANPKDRFWHERRSVTQLRAAWAIAANIALEQAGVEERLDPRSLADRGIPRPAEERLAATKTRQAKYRGKACPEWQAILDARAQQQATHPQEQAKAVQWWEQQKRELGIANVHTLQADTVRQYVSDYTRRGVSGQHVSPAILEARAQQTTNILHTHETHDARLHIEKLRYATYATQGRTPTGTMEASARQLLAIGDTLLDDTHTQHQGVHYVFQDRDTGLSW
jgi:hypothetical protein